MICSLVDIRTLFLFNQNIVYVNLPKQGIIQSTIFCKMFVVICTVDFYFNVSVTGSISCCL